VHGDQPLGTDELVELDVVHVTPGASLGGVQDDEDGPG
jgi:hypothetical protein